MFINIAYKDEPELSVRRQSSEPDLSVEKTLLVNPNCPIRIMLEYIRKKCKLGIFAQFDLCDETGGLMGLFELPTYAYATDRFEHKRTYYIIVLKQAYKGTRHFKFVISMDVVGWIIRPKCPIHLLVEYIGQKYKLGIFAQFDLCGVTGGLMGLFEMPTYAYATDRFEHKRTYYIIVLKQEADKRLSVLPQLNHENLIYLNLKDRVKRFIATGVTSPLVTPPPGKVTPPGKPISKKK